MCGTLPNLNPPSGLLNLATDWKILFDLGTSTYVFLSLVSNSQKRPDICLFSVQSLCVILIELTCPREENMEDGDIIKWDSYATPCDSIKNCGWIVSFFFIEVGVSSDDTVVCKNNFGL